jgi:integrase/recombinase XerD
MAGPRSKVTKVVVEGPLAPYVEVYRSRLSGFGYTPLSIVNELRQVAHLSRWMQARELDATDLTVEGVEAFLAPRRAAKGHRGSSFQGLVPLVDVLVELGVSAESPTRPPASARQETLASFGVYLIAERGLASCTAAAYVERARRFVEGLAEGCELGDLTAAHVTEAVGREAARVSIGSTQYFVAGVRAFLRFCLLEGLVATDLSAAALGVTGRRRSSLPQGISAADAVALLRSCDRRRSDHRRDYAVLLVLLRLGLRAGEVAGLTLEDIDWRAGLIVVRGKGGREDRLPLPVDVGEAISGYLRRGRPPAPGRELFVRSLAPLGPLSRGGVSAIVRRACRRAGIAPVGAHRLRHTLACSLVSAGAGLPEIGEVLRHRSISSTAIYARVDIEALRALAQPWLGEQT